MKRKFIFFGLLGIVVEILFTGICSLKKKDVKLSATTSLWMFPIYGMAAFLEPICKRLKNKCLVIRGIVYTFCIFFTEYICGWLLKKITGMCPWDYSKSRYNIKGLIRLDYAPFWFLLGLFFEGLLVKLFRKSTIKKLMG